MAPVPVGLLVSGVKAVKIVIFAMPFLKPHAISPIFVVVPGMLIMVLGVLVMAIIVSFFALIVAMFALSHRRRRQKYDWQQQGGP